MLASGEYNHSSGGSGQALFEHHQAWCTRRDVYRHAALDAVGERINGDEAHQHGMRYPALALRPLSAPTQLQNCIIAP